MQVVALNNSLQHIPLADTAAREAAVRVAPSLDSYFDTLLGGFAELLDSCRPAPSPAAHPVVQLYVDCANGVGAAQLAVAAARLQASEGGLQLHLVNQGGDAGTHCGLNHHCGADYVQKEQVAPHGFHTLPAASRYRGPEGGL
jgi:phosphoacetylglucosamine mutase